MAGEFSHLGRVFEHPDPADPLFVLLLMVVGPEGEVFVPAITGGVHTLYRRGRCGVCRRICSDVGEST